MGSVSSKKKKKITITSAKTRDIGYGDSGSSSSRRAKRGTSPQETKDAAGHVTVHTPPISQQGSVDIKPYDQLQTTSQENVQSGSSKMSNQPNGTHPPPQATDSSQNVSLQEDNRLLITETIQESSQQVGYVESAPIQLQHGAEDEGSSDEEDTTSQKPDKQDDLDFHEKVDKALNGEYDFQIPEKTKIVRIFTSSTFTDTSVERNTLMERIYPRLKQFCHESGYEFQVVDMRWGVRDESTDDHLTSELCMRELRACQELSTGPNFITFLGQKYGYRPFPPRIPASEFDRLLSAAQSQDDSQLLRLWFRRDDNTVPSEYLLQPITDLLPDYRNYDNEALRKKASGEWWAAFERMQVVLREASDKVLEKRERQKYYMSVTEDEIRRGIVNASNPDKHCFWFKRVITDLKENIASSNARKFIDKTWGPEGTMDEEAYRLLNRFRENILPKALSSSNIKEYDVNWSPNGIDPSSSSQHARYLENLCQNFYDVLTEMIGTATREREAVQVKDPLAEEVFSHLSFCKKKCEAFHGREQFLKYIKETLLQSRKRTVVLHGESGCGKTSVMAKVCTLVKEWLGVETVAVVSRFIGISPDSSNVRSLLRSVCSQLCRVAGSDTDNVPEDMKSLAEYFPECLENAANDKTVVVILDSLDQLSPDNGGRQMDWLPKTLPDNVYMVVSTLPGEEHECLPKLKAILPESCLKEVPAIPLNEADLILSNWLEAVSRSLTEKQKRTVLDAFQQCPLPLYLKLAFDEACRWKSYTPDDQLCLPDSVKGIINALFDRIERVHGTTLVSHALGYITASKNGLTEPELEDILSLDDQVLNDVYQYWTPPIRRLPPLLWIRIRADINDYLIDRGADDARVIYWYHRQFIEIARKRYLERDDATKLHANMSGYFLGSWSEGVKKPFTNKKGENLSMDRLVPKQPFVFDKSREQPIYNLRMLSELPFHLTYSNKLKTLKERALCNFDFLITKLRAASLEAVLEDFSAALNVFPDDADLDELERTLRLSSVALTIDPRQLASQLLGRLLPHISNKEEYPFLSVLLERSYASPVPCLIPSRKCLTAPGGTLVSSIAIDESGIHCCAFSCDGRTAYLGSTTSDGLQLRIFNIQTGKVLRKLNLTEPFEMVYTWSMEGSKKDKDNILIMGSKFVFLMNAQTGKIIKTFDALEEETRYNPMPPVTFADDENYLAAITDKNLKIWNVPDGSLQHTLSVGDINLDEDYGSIDAQGQLVAYGLNTKVFRVLNVQSGKQVREVEVFAKGEEATIKTVKIGSEGRIVVVPSTLKSLKIYSLHSGAPLNEITEFSMNPGLQRLQVTTDGAKVLSIVQYEVMITDLEKSEVKRTLKSKSFGTLVIHTNLFSRDGRYACSIGHDNIMRIYDLKKALAEDEEAAKHAPSIPGMAGAAVASMDRINGIFPGVDGKHVIGVGTVQYASELSMWDVTSGTKIRALKVTEMPPQEIRMCSSTRGVGYMHDMNLLHFKVYNFAEGKIERCLAGKASTRTNAFGAVDEEHVIALSNGRRNLKVWDIDSGRLVKQYKFGQTHPLEEIFISTNGRRVVCSQISNQVEHTDETLPLVSLDTKTGQHKLLQIQGTQLSLIFSSISADGRYLICATKDMLPRLWDCESGKLLHHLEEEEYPISYASGISVPLKLALTAQSDGNINAWGIDDGRIKHTFKCETVDKIMISSDGNVAYSRYRYRSSNLDAWDLRNGSKLATFTSDWKPERVDVVGDALVLGQADSPSILCLRLHHPQSTRDLPSKATSPFDGIPVEGTLLPCQDTPTADDGDDDKDDDGDKTDVQKFEYTKKAMHVKPNVIIGGGNIVDAKNVFISEAVFKQNFQT